MKQTYHLKSILLLTGFLLLIPYWSAAQSFSYAYDNAGNRISRTIILSQPLAAKQQNKDSVFYQEILSNKEIKLYPNPVKTTLSVFISGYDKNIKGEYSLFDIQGKAILYNTLKSESFEIDMSAYSTGNYIMRLVINDEATTWKIIKQ